MASVRVSLAMLVLRTQPSGVRKGVLMCRCSDGTQLRSQTTADINRQISE